MPRLSYPRKGEPIAADWGRAVVDAINELSGNPKICPPLAHLDGAIYLGQDYQLYNAKTTGTITARSGTTWGQGDADFYTVDESGVEQVVLGIPAFTAWSYFGASIPSGIRIQVCWAYERWVIVGGDCSGVA